MSGLQHQSTATAGSCRGWDAQAYLGISKLPGILFKHFAELWVLEVLGQPTHILFATAIISWRQKLLSSPAGSCMAPLTSCVMPSDIDDDDDTAVLWGSHVLAMPCLPVTVVLMRVVQ